MFKANLKPRTFDKVAFLRDLKKGTLDLREKTARAYVRAVFSRIPVWSGAARATLIPLATLAKMGELAASIRPIAFEGRHYPKGDPNHGIDSGVNHGLQSSIDNSFPEVGFTFETDLLHFFLHEENSWNDWGALEAGRNAASEYISTNADKFMPKMNKYIRRRK